jgi:hypothetical protein
VCATGAGGGADDEQAARNAPAEATASAPRKEQSNCMDVSFTRRIERDIAQQDDWRYLLMSNFALPNGPQRTAP